MGLMGRAMAKQKQFISRYTSLASALQLGQTGHLTLLDPLTWKDKNDTQYLEAYSHLSGCRSVQALCFTSASETSHHWQAFAPGLDGVRIDFKPDALRNDVSAQADLVFREVEYRDVSMAKQNARDVELLPFLKRRPYEQEKEIRLLFRSRHVSPPGYQLPISPRSISRVVLSPALPNALTSPVKDAVKAVSIFPNLKVYRSTLLENETWLRHVRQAAGNRLQSKIAIGEDDEG